MSLEVLDPALRLLARPGTKNITIGAAAVEDWPAGLLVALLKTRIFTPGPVAQGTLCPGCTRGCMMEVICLGAAGQTGPDSMVVCDKAEDHGIIGVDAASLQQWCSSRERLSRFLASQLRRRVKTADPASDLIRFGTSKRLKQSIALEFSDAPKLMIGNERHDLTDLLLWDGHSISLDWDLLHALADRTDALSDGRLLSAIHSQLGEKKAPDPAARSGLAGRDESSSPRSPQVEQGALRQRSRREFQASVVQADLARDAGTKIVRRKNFA